MKDEQMLNGTVFGIISKEEGRKYILKTPLNKFQRMVEKTYNPAGASQRYKDIYHFEMIGSLKTIVNSHLAILSLFNDCCSLCGKPFTHYAIIKGYKSEYLRLIPIAFDDFGGIIDYNIDHIYPKSKGGSNLLQNFQLTCVNANCSKSDLINDYVLKYGVRKECTNAC